MIPISRILSRFSTNKNFWWCTWTPTSNNTAFHNNIVAIFVVDQDRLKTNLLQLFGRPEFSEWYSIISVIIFEINIVDEQKQTLLVTIFVFFISFHCPKIFYCPRCSGVPKYACCVINFAKTLVANLNMTSLWHHKQRISSDNVHHMPLLNTRIW